MELDNNECSICRKKYDGWGNNAAPLTGRCCDSCNSEIVMPLRIKLMTISEKINYTLEED